ncbi:MAG: DUF2062 domain-containing protein [Myxococcales bacterium]|nr:DUF2062 domain-containing protein [Myxococcales bacterium]
MNLLRSVRRLHARIHAWWLALLAEHSDPGQLAAAVLVGAIAGCTPLFGLHFPLCLALAWVLRLNKVTVYLAANISIPPLAPFLGFASVQIGERLLHGRWLMLDLAEFRHHFPSLVARFFVDWLVGGLLVGAAIGAVLASAVYGIATARRRTAVTAADPVRAAILAASRRFRAVARPLRMYAFFKYRLDPCYRAIAPLVPDGAFAVDLGTGMGMLPLVLALLPGKRRVLGVDWDAPKLAAGRTAAAGLDGVELAFGDARDFTIPPCDVITLVDVLHYYEPPVQRALLSRCAESLRPGGLLLVREGDAARQSGARWTRSLEAAAVGIGWNRGDGRPKFRSLDDLRAEIESLGFQVQVDPVAGKLHPGNVLLRGVREGQARTT